LNHADANGLLGHYHLAFTAYHPSNGETPFHGC
jgi:hypothetical protein